MAVHARRQMHADAIRAPHFGHGIGHFQHQPGALFAGAAIGVGAMIGAVLQELVEQIAIGAVNLHAVKAGRLGVLRALFDRRR